MDHARVMYVGFRATMKPGKVPVSCLPWDLCDEGVFLQGGAAGTPPTHTHLQESQVQIRGSYATQMAAAHL